MATLLRAKPKVFSPLGLSDTLDGSAAPAGACYSLQNLIHDVTTRNVWVCRPGAFLETNFPGFNTPGYVSLMFAVGPRIYGMVATAATPGFDEPFSYNIDTGLFDPMTGVAAGNVPSSPATSGFWNPPTADLIGTKIIITHPGYSGTGANFFGVIDVSNPAAPVYSSSNTSLNPLPAVPVAVANFNDRAYFAVNNQLWFTDALVPLVITNATNVLTCGDSAPLNAIGKMSLSTTAGGIITGLIAFKLAGGFFQVTGDISAAGGSTLMLQGPTGNVGCIAPRSVVTTPAGIFYMAEDGIRLIDFTGQLQPQPIPNVRYPFDNAQDETRAAAAYNDSVYRISLLTIPNSTIGATGYADYWYDFEINQWSGPHTISYDCICAPEDHFIVSTPLHPGALYHSHVTAVSSNVYTEFGAALEFVLQSAIFPQDSMSVQAMIESTVDIGFGASLNPVTIQLLDSTLGIIGQQVIVPATTGTVWGSFNWGAALWTAATFGLSAYNVDWSEPMVYKKAAVAYGGVSAFNLRLGNFWSHVEDVPYSNVQNPA